MTAAVAGPAGGAPVRRGRWTRRRVVDTSLQLAPLALVVVAEAAWITIVGGLVQQFALHRTEIGIPTMAAFVLAGAVLGHAIGPRLGAAWPFAALGLVTLGALAGWALSGDAREALADGPLAALGTHPGGLVAGLAVLRGIAHARLPLAEDTVSRLLGIGIPGVAIAALLGGMIGEPLRSAFLGQALGSAIVFVTAAALALALVRLDDVGLDGGFDWRRNPPWLLLTILVLAAAIALAVPLAAVTGTVLSALLSVALFPLFVLGLATGLDRTARRVLATMAVVSIAVIVGIRLFGREHEVPLTQPPPAGDQPLSTAADQFFTVSVGGLLLLGAIVLVIVLVALWMRRSSAPEGSVQETRTIDPGGDSPGRTRRRGWFGRHREPRTAVEAYVDLLDELDRRADVRREPGETPAGHAARLRGDPRAGLALDLLAADYALARYGGVALTAREDARGVDRWRSLRRRLARGGRRPGALAGDTAVPQVGMDAAGARAGTRTGG